MPLTGAKDHKLRFPEFCIGIHGRVVGKVGVLGKMLGGNVRAVTNDAVYWIIKTVTVHVCIAVQSFCLLERRYNPDCPFDACIGEATRNNVSSIHFVHLPPCIALSCICSRLA